MHSRFYLGCKAALLVLLVLGLVADLPVGATESRRPRVNNAGGDFTDEELNYDGSFKLGLQFLDIPYFARSAEMFSAPKYGLSDPREAGLSVDDPCIVRVAAGSFHLCGGALPFSKKMMMNAEIASPTDTGYFIGVLSSTAADDPKVERKLGKVGAGLQFVERLSATALIFQASYADLSAAESNGMFVKVVPYHSAFALGADIGNQLYSDPRRAMSDIYDLSAVGFKGVSAEELASQISALGISVTHSIEIGGRAYLRVDAQQDLINSMAQVRGIKTLNENPNVIYVATESNMPLFRTVGGAR